MEHDHVAVPRTRRRSWKAAALFPDAPEPGAPEENRTPFHWRRRPPKAAALFPDAPEPGAPEKNRTPFRGRRRSSKAAALFLAAAAGLGAGCEMPAMPELPSLPSLPVLPELPGIPGVYRIDIQQGNVIDREMLDRLEVGMEPDKVRFILGTPLLIDPFNPNRWEYIYSLRRGSGEEVRQRVSVYFADDRFERIESDLGSGALPELEAERTQTRVKVPKRQPSKGFLDSLVPDFLAEDPDPETDATEDDAQPTTE